MQSANQLIVCGCSAVVQAAPRHLAQTRLGKSSCVRAIVAAESRAQLSEQFRQTAPRSRPTRHRQPSRAAGAGICELGPGPPARSSRSCAYRWGPMLSSGKGLFASRGTAETCPQYTRSRRFARMAAHTLRANSGKGLVTRGDFVLRDT